jgi:hypothetical protein
MRRPSPATVLSALALFFALSGTTIAASRYLVSSTTQIEPSVLTSLRATASSAGLGRVTYASKVGGVEADSQNGATVRCPSGQIAISGGVYVNSANPLDSVAASIPHIGSGSHVPNEWEGWESNATSETQSFTVYAVCASASSTSVASSFIKK